jgi:two-component system, sporulation sensor kinase C
VSTLGQGPNCSSISLHRQVARQGVGLLISDTASRRLVEAISTQLELVPSMLSEGELSASYLLPYEMIIADEPIARRVRMILESGPRAGDGIRPALVAVLNVPLGSTRDDHDEFDAVLSVAEKPATIGAQLSVALYSYRAFARRYQSALDELNLNRNIFKSVTSGISVANAMDPDLPLIYVNPAFEVMTGYTLEEVQGKNCRFLQRGDREQPGLALVRDAVANQRETIAVLKNYRKDGSAFWNELSLSPIRNQAGVVTHLVGIQMDVTERVEFETALRESEKLAAVGRLASAIAHEINNPLEAVMNLVYLSESTLRRDAASTDALRYLSQADLELQRIKLITAQSLRFCKQSYSPEAITCEDLLSPILDIYNPRLASFGISVKRRERAEQNIVCLASEIRQVFSNLISNAMDAMRRSGGRLVVRTREATHWTDHRRGVIVTVADTGHGMSEKTQANIYKAFYTTKGAAGTGLGLWITSDIIKRHHGYLKVRSRTTQGRTGTVFQVFLPFQAAHAGEQGDSATGSRL